ncbi:MAG: hypothetical protein U0936_18530 [Planctomycetaceae bacterium]
MKELPAGKLKRRTMLVLALNGSRSGSITSFDRSLPTMALFLRAEAGIPGAEASGISSAN